MKENRFCKSCSLKTEHEIINYNSANRNPRGFAKYKCNSCDKAVMYKSRGFLFFLFWPWTMLFMKKRCPVCGTEVTKI